MEHRVTYLVSASQIEAVFTMRDAVECVEAAFRLYGEEKVQMPPKVYLTFEKGDLRMMPVYLPTLSIAGVKIVNVHPQNRDIPAVMGITVLVDPATGLPLAVLDATYLTALRTGAAGAVAARYLARDDSRVVGFVGAGRQAETQLDGLMVTRPGIAKVLAYDLDSSKAERFCARCRALYSLEATTTSGPQGAVNGADIVVTTTPSRAPVVRGDWVCPGTHINAIGADAPGKQELDPAILLRARVVIDNWEQASHSGEINVPLAQGLIARRDISCDIGEVVTGRRTARQAPTDVTVFDSTGLAIQDIACAFQVYRRLTATEAGRQELATIELF
jgi:alanine dehydrogenase